MFKAKAKFIPHGRVRQYMRKNLRLEPVDDVLLLSGTPQAVTLTAFRTLLRTSGVGQQFDLPDGEYPGQRKHLKADIVGGSDTAVASAAALTKLRQIAFAGGAGLTGQATVDVPTAVAFDADNEEILIEWTGALWNILYASAGVVTAS